jgi:hypothetical protein
VLARGARDEDPNAVHVDRVGTRDKEAGRGRDVRGAAVELAEIVRIHEHPPVCQCQEPVSC